MATVIRYVLQLERNYIPGDFLKTFDDETKAVTFCDKSQPEAAMKFTTYFDAMTYCNDHALDKMFIQRKVEVPARYADQNVWHNPVPHAYP